MNKYLTILSADLKTIKREPTLFIMLFIPILMLLILRFGLPILNGYLPELINFNPLLCIFFCIIVAAFPSFIISFIILDEKDQTLIPLLRVMPIKLIIFLKSRLLFIIFFGFINSLLILNFNSIFVITFYKTVIISFLAAITSPSVFLITISFAKNKIEGVTLMKILNVLLILPIISIFINHFTKYLFCFFPNKM